MMRAAGMGEDRARILVVDDEEKNLKLLTALLDHQGHETETARSGFEALEKAGSFRPDLILLDLMMPGMDGYEVCRRLKGNQATAALPVIMITALNDRASRLRGLEAGASEFLGKPVDRAELLVRVGNLLQVRRFADFLESHNHRLAREVEHRTAELDRALQEVTMGKKELEQAMARLLESEKLASLGLLAAGIAHEINNPAAYITTNLQVLRKYAGRLAEFIGGIADLGTGNGAVRPEELASLRQNTKVDSILDDLSAMITESLDGMERITHIVQGLRRFARQDEAVSSLADLNQCLRRALEITRNEWKYVAEIKEELAELPPVGGFPQQLTQVFINLLVNAAQAMQGRGEIRVRSWQTEAAVHVSIEDTGCGMAAETMARIFTPLFTTKEPGRGTGLGLSISREIVRKHQGEITVESEVGRGATFTVSLPLTSG